MDSYGEKGTRETYLTAVKAFLRDTYGNAEDVATLAERYRTETGEGKRDCFRDLLAFINTRHEKPPATLHTYMAAIKNYLLYCCGIDLPRRTNLLLQAKMPRGDARGQ